jgi:hypothetical protein
MNSRDKTVRETIFLYVLLKKLTSDWGVKEPADGPRAASASEHSMPLRQFRRLRRGGFGATGSEEVKDETREERLCAV